MPKSTRTANRRKNTKTTEDGKSTARDRAQELHDRLTDQVSALTDSEQWKRYLKTLAAFHDYSLNNVLLILAQRPTATRVAGYRTWQNLGRQVRKGEKAIKIFGYSTKKVTETDPDTGDEVTKNVAWYPILSVFDIEQTDGEPLPDSGIKHLHAEDTTQIYQRVSDWLARDRWTVERGNTGPAEGWTSHKERIIRISEQLDPASTAAVLVHEAGHAVLHGDLEPGEYQTHRGRCEVEAESVAYVVAGLLGLDTSTMSVGYVAGWAKGDPEAVRATADNVHRAVQTITTALLPSQRTTDDHVEDHAEGITGEAAPAA